VSYSAKDFERADELWSDDAPKRGEVAQLIADVRREVLEEAAILVTKYPITPDFDLHTADQVAGRDDEMAAKIRALKDGAP